MTEVFLEVAIIFLLLIANGIFAMSELAMVSARRARLQKRASAGHRGAQVALELSQNPGAFLATVQIGITLIGILAGAFGGAKLASHLGELLQSVSWLSAHSQVIAFWTVVVGITFFSLVLGELVPKRLALNSAETIAAVVARPLRGMAWAVHPLVRLLEVSCDALLWICRFKKSSEPSITQEELKILVCQATQAGVLEMSEQEILHNVLRFGDQTAGTLMTPRQDIVWLDLAEPFEKLREIVVASGHTHYPVGRNALNEVGGFLSIKSMFAHPEVRTNEDLRRFLLEPLYVPNTVPALRLLETFKTARKHVALVVDEFGVVRGIVTVNDVLESLVGELPETLGSSESIVQRKDGSWLVDGMVPLDRLKNHFRLGLLPGEGQGAYQTLSGFVMSQLSRVPRTGDRFEWGGLRFEVIDMDETRVDKVLIQTASKT